MGSVSNVRILRFLIVLSAVILTIFIYASYSNTTLATPHMQHMRAAGAQPPAAAALNSPAANHSREASLSGENVSTKYTNSNGTSGGSGNANFNPLTSVHLAKANRHAAAVPSAAASNGAVNAKKQHYRQPTIDEDGAANGGVGLDDTNDDLALDRFVSNYLLEEQYAQSIDNTLGNINNTASAQSQQVVTQQQQQQQQQLLTEVQLQQQQQQQQNQLVDSNNINKILDSEVLIPTSNLQKFIENADRILKNITALPPSVASKPIEKESPVIKVEEVAKQDPPQNQPQQQQAPPSSGGAAEVTADDGIALPPSAVMTIKRTESKTVSAAAAVSSPVDAKPPAPPVPAAATKSNVKAPPKINSTTARAAPDTTKGIPTYQIYEGGHMNEEINIEKLCPNEGADLRLLILITSAQAHVEARLAIRQTWAHYGIRRDVSTAFILGRSTNETLNLALTQENFIYGDLIRGNFIDSYNNLTLKTISALEWVDEHCARAKYVLKTDDDMFINVPKLLTFLDNHAKEKRVIYGRLAKKWKPIRNKKSKYYVSSAIFAESVFPPFTTGPAYVMSSDIIHELYAHALQLVYLKLEDVFTTGVVAQHLAIKRVHVNEFLNRRIAFNPCNIRKTISVHMIKSNEQFDLWKKLLDQTTKCK